VEEGQELRGVREVDAVGGHRRLLLSCKIITERTLPHQSRHRHRHRHRHRQIAGGCAEGR
jgi:hypothetical protein